MTNLPFLKRTNKPNYIIQPGRPRTGSALLGNGQQMHSSEYPVTLFIVNKTPVARSVCTVDIKHGLNAGFRSIRISSGFTTLLCKTMRGEDNLNKSHFSLFEEVLLICRFDRSTHRNTTMSLLVCFVPHISGI